METKTLPIHIEIPVDVPVGARVFVGLPIEVGLLVEEDKLTPIGYSSYEDGDFMYKDKVLYRYNSARKYIPWVKVGPEGEEDDDES